MPYVALAKQGKIFIKGFIYEKALFARLPSEKIIKYRRLIEIPNYDRNALITAAKRNRE
jgi:hypothetical protein